MTTLKAPFPYMGGKSRIAPVVWQRLGDVPNYVLCAETCFCRTLTVMPKRVATSFCVPLPARYAAAAFRATDGSYTGGRPVRLVALLVDHLRSRRAFISPSIALPWNSGR